MTTRLVLVGCGKMGGALLGGWLDRGIDAAGITVVEPAAGSVDALGRPDLRRVDTVDQVAADPPPDIVVLAVKPQVMDDVAAPYRRFAEAGSVFLSIAAGRSITSFERLLGNGAAIVRAMPNTPASVRRGITVACANRHVSAEARKLCHALLEAVGEVGWIDDEAQMDAVTAVSGSGPAYVFLLAECLARAGVEAGLPADLAERLARATVSGAGELMHRSPEAAGQLRQNVTSPGGTTAAALEVLMAEDALQPLLTAAVDAATRRSRELAG